MNKHYVLFHIYYIYSILIQCTWVCARYVLWQIFLCRVCVQRRMVQYYESMFFAQNTEGDLFLFLSLSLSLGIFAIPLYFMYQHLCCCRHFYVYFAYILYSPSCTSYSRFLLKYVKIPFPLNVISLATYKLMCVPYMRPCSSESH